MEARYFLKITMSLPTSAKTSRPLLLKRASESPGDLREKEKQSGAAGLDGLHSLLLWSLASSIRSSQKLGEKLQTGLHLRHDQNLHFHRFRG